MGENIIVVVFRALSLTPFSSHQLSMIFRYLFAMSLIVSDMSNPWMIMARSSANAYRKLGSRSSLYRSVFRV